MGMWKAQYSALAGPAPTLQLLGLHAWMLSTHRLFSFTGSYSTLRQLLHNKRSGHIVGNYMWPFTGATAQIGRSPTTRL